MNINNLPNDILDKIYEIVNIKCHNCFIRFSFDRTFYCKVGKNYFCSEECYLHI